MAIQPGQLQSVGGVLDTTFQLYKASVARVVPICLLLVLASSPPSIYVMSQGAATPGDPFAVLRTMQNPTYWLTYAISLILTLWIIAALYLKMHAIGTDQELSLSEALQGGLSRVPVLLLMTILLMIALAIGFVLLLVPGFILMVSLILGVNLVLFEGKGPIDALSGSHRLVWGNWWRTAAILTVGFIVVVVLYMVAGLLVGVMVPLVGLGIGDLLVTSFVAGLLIGGLMNLLVTPFYVALLISVYWDLKVRKEGGDLAARVGALNPA